MQTASTIARLTLLAVGVAGALAAADANAAAFQLKENSAKGLGRAFAGSTSTEGDASVIATNPASMRLLDGTLVQGDVSAISFGAKFRGWVFFLTHSVCMYVCMSHWYVPIFFRLNLRA